MTEEEYLQALRNFHGLQPTGRVEAMMSIWVEMEDRLAMVASKDLTPKARATENIRTICFAMLDVARRFAPEQTQRERMRIMDAIGAAVEKQAQVITAQMQRLAAATHASQEMDTGNSGGAESLLTLAVTDLRRRVDRMETATATSDKEA